MLIYIGINLAIGYKAGKVGTGKCYGNEQQKGGFSNHSHLPHSYTFIERYPSFPLSER